MRFSRQGFRDVVQRPIIPMSTPMSFLTCNSSELGHRDLKGQVSFRVPAWAGTAARARRGLPTAETSSERTSWIHSKALIHSIRGGRTAAQIGLPLGSVRPSRPMRTPDA